MITFARIRSQIPARLSKHFELKNGELTKLPGGALVRGTVETLSVENINELADAIRELGPAEALTFGVPTHEGAVICASEAARNPDAIVRNRECWRWPDGPGVLLLDYDPAQGEPPMAFPALWAALVGAAPELASVPALAVPSASSCIFGADGTEHRGVRGWHIFLLVADAKRTPEYGAALAGRLWLAGHGRIAISKSGAMLERTLVDGSVWQPERLSFDGGASLGDGLVQRRLEHMQFLNADGEPLADLQTLTQGEQRKMKKLIVEAKAAARPEADQVREQWVDERVDEAVKRSPKTDVEIIRQTYTQALQRRELLADFVLVTAQGEQISVGEMLKAPSRWDGALLRDPLEPGYNGGAATAKAFLKGPKPRVHSFAHGGCNYVLRGQSEPLQLDEDQWPRIVDRCIGALATDEAVFDYGGTLIAIDQAGVAFPVSPHWICTALERKFAVTKFDARQGGQVPSKIPLEIAQRILSVRERWTFPQLTSLCDHRLIDEQTPGYHRASGIYIHADPTKWKPIPRDVSSALTTLWYPVSLFPYSSPADRGSALAMLLTAVVRPTMETAPAFLVTSTTFSSGKTKLSEVAALLAGGNPSGAGFTPDDDEMEKRLAGLLMQGSPSITFDNASGLVGGDVLARLLTQGTFSARRLGTNDYLRLPSRALVIVNGVNASPSADTVRRFLTVRLDPGIERPEEQDFPFDPVAWTREHIEEMRAAALCILRAARSQKATLGSFERWSEVVLSAVLTIGGEYGNPMETMQRARTEDPELEQLEAFLSGWHALVADRPMLISDMLRRVDESVSDIDAQIYKGVLLEIAGVRGNVDPARMAKFMRRHAGRVAGGLRIVRGPKRHSGVAWMVKESPMSPISPHFTPIDESVNASRDTHDSYDPLGKNKATSATSATSCPRCGGEGCAHCEIAGVRL